MLSDLEIYRAANQMIQQYGEEAAFETAARADSMLAKGDLEGQRVWKRILRAVKELQRDERVEGEARH